MLQPQVSSPSTATPDRRGVPNRHPSPLQVFEMAGEDDFRRLAERHFQRCRRDGRVLSALLLQAQFDIEPGGAQRLQLMADCANRLRCRVRGTDTVARWQGTGFGVLLPQCSAVNAQAVLARLVRVGSCRCRLGGRPLTLRLQGQVLGAGEL